MNVKKFLKAALAAALILALLPACSDDKGDGAKNTTEAKTEAVSGTVSESVPVETVIETAPPVDKDAVKDQYTLSEDEAAAIADKNAPAAIKYASFDSMVFTTPAISEKAPLMTITPIFNAEGVHSYLHEAGESFDLGNGNGSFSSTMAIYDDAFFEEKALLVVAFLDKEGGSAYSVTGAWDDHIVGEGFEMDRLVFGVKRAEGDVTAGHVIIEIDPEFLSIWDTYGMEFYR